MKNESKVSPVKHSGWNRLSAAILIISLIVVCYGTALINNFATAAKLQNFLHESKAFNYTADIIKAEISEKLPQKIKNNVIELTLINKFMDYVITAENIEKLAQPGLRLTYKAADTPTTIQDNKVVIATATYKDQAISYINGLGLADALKEPAQSLVNSVPQELTIIDNSKHPNNPIMLLIRVRDTLRTVHTVVDVLWWVIPIGFIVVLLLNLRNLRRLSKTLAWIFGVPAVVVLLGSWLFPALIGVFGARNNDPIIGDQVNGLSNSASSYLFATTRNFGLVCLVLSAIFTLIYIFLPMQKIQHQLDSQLDILAKKVRGSKKKASTHK